VSLLTSPLVGTLAIAASAMFAFSQTVEAGKTKQSEFGIALQQTTNLVDALQIATQNTKSNFWTDGFRESLEDLPGLMDRVREANESIWVVKGFADNKALENLQQMGVELAALAQTDFGSVLEGFQGMAAGMDEIKVETLLNQMPELRAEFVKAAIDIGEVGSEGDVLALAMGNIDYAAEKSARSLEEISGVAVDASKAIADLSNEILNFGSAQISSDRAAIALQDNIRKLNKIVNDGAGELGYFTENGSNTEKAMLDIAEAAKKSAASVMEAGGAQADANAILDDARQKLIDQRVALGEDAEAAKAWADQRVPTANAVQQALEKVTGAAKDIPKDTPANVTTDAGVATEKLKGTKGAQDSIKPHVNTSVSADTGAAMGALTGVSNLLASISMGAHVGVTAAVSVPVDSGGGRAYGGTVGLASGGTVPGRSRHVLGIGGGVSDGTVWGRGTAKSDSINVNLSKGEEVIQEPWASYYRSELKQMNAGAWQPGRQQTVATVVNNYYSSSGELVVRDVNNQIVGRMQVEANRAVDSFVQDSAREGRKARY
ncbi:hypothetical protein, partial [Leucobacter sp. M11]|uniref:hypothetical protein n=1 Tax=Leucobacter sp. M11 TaxID=2993565 RepID=UPI002D7F7C21